MVRIEAKQEVTLIRDYQNEVNELKEELEKAQSIEYNEEVVKEIRERLENKT